MPSGMPIDRQWVIVLTNGTPIIEWEEGLGVDLYTGEFIHYQPGDYSHAVQDAELDMLKKSGRIMGFDQYKVFVVSLPELPHHSGE